MILGRGFPLFILNCQTVSLQNEVSWWLQQYDTNVSTTESGQVLCVGRERYVPWQKHYITVNLNVFTITHDLNSIIGMEKPFEHVSHTSIHRDIEDHSQPIIWHTIWWEEENIMREEEYWSINNTIECPIWVLWWTSKHQHIQNCPWAKASVWSRENAWQPAGHHWLQ